MRTQYNEIVSWEEITYGQLTNQIQQVALKVCRQDKMLRQLAKDRAQRRKDLGSFCEQFGLPSCYKKPHKRPKPTKHFEKPPIYKKKYQPKQPLPIQSPPIQSPQITNSSPVCYKCHKPGHIARYCKLNQRISTLGLEDQVKTQISNLLIESETDDSEREEDYVNQLDDGMFHLLPKPPAMKIKKRRSYSQCID